MAKQTEVQKFRDTATEQDWKDLADLVNDASSRTKALPTERFPFSYNAVAPDLEERGLITRTKRDSSEKSVDLTTPDGNKMFLITNFKADTTKISRSVQINEDILERLKNLENDNGQYTHSSVLNQILDDGLKIYGY